MRYALTGLYLIVVSSASAQDAAPIPQIDVDSYCQRASFFADNPTSPAHREIVRECVTTEQSAYDALKLVWGDLPATVQAQCFSRRMNQAYQYLRARDCAYQYLSDQQERAEERAPIPNFRR